MAETDDQNFFSEEFMARNVKSQEELDAGFLEFPDLARSYVWIALSQPETKDWYQKEWPKVRRYLDKDFLRIFKKVEPEHTSRSWEFHLAVALNDHDVPLREKTWEEGPDFCIGLPNGKKVWIEAITCTLGTEDPVDPPPVLKSGQIYSFGGNIEDINRPRALRITSAIGAKFEKYKEYLKCGIVSENDCLVIAVNGRLIQHHSEANMLFKYAVFGQGPEVLVRVPGKEKLQGGFYKPIETIIKKANGKEEPIPPHFMEMEEFSLISAVVYCGHSAAPSWYNGYAVGADFIFAYHTNPTNPLPDGLFPFGRGVWKDPATSNIRVVSQGDTTNVYG